MNENQAAELYEDLLWAFTGRIARMTDAELLAKAVAFNCGPPAFINGHLNFPQDGKYWWQPKESPPVEVEYRYHVQVRFGGKRWVIDNGHALLNKHGEWEYAGLNSSQTDDFRDRTRWDSAREAIEFFERHRRWEWDVYEQVKDTPMPALWEEMERLLAEKYNS